ncbi:MAG TPA: hypothetical protein VK001_04475 [Geminicoccaceae bacterium]|nr:hypothetical protein [Geminicoccaceae bacterium]
MLRDERQLALNAAIEACLHAAHVHEDSAELIGDNASHLRELAATRRRNAETIGEHVRRLGDLPTEPDPEYELATDVISHIKGALAENDRREAIERSKAAEEALATALEEALRQDLPADCRRDIEQILAAQRPLA